MQAGSGHGGFVIISEVKETTRRLPAVKEWRHLARAAASSRRLCPLSDLLPYYS